MPILSLSQLHPRKNIDDLHLIASRLHAGPWHVRHDYSATCCNVETMTPVLRAVAATNALAPKRCPMQRLRGLQRRAVRPSSRVAELVVRPSLQVLANRRPWLRRPIGSHVSPDGMAHLRYNFAATRVRTPNIHCTSTWPQAPLSIFWSPPAPGGTNAQVTA